MKTKTKTTGKMNAKAVGATIRDLRIKAGYDTQGEFGKVIGKNGATVSLMERGHRPPNVNTLIKMKDIFKVSVDTILGV
jgi:DNA-binding XRE family transcriptional regulator